MGDATGAARDYADSLGIEKGRRVQEVGWDEDCDTAISESIEEFLGEDLLDEDTDEVVDVVLLWWREEDGDLVDGLVDAARPMADNGRIWLLTPGAGRPNAIDAGTIDAIWDDLRELMRDGVRVGRIDTVRPEHTPEAMGREPRADDHGGEVYVYRRTGQPCHVCGTPVAETPIEARRVFYCPTCQPV